MHDVLHMVYSIFTLSEASDTGELSFSSMHAAPLTLYAWSGPAQEHQLSDAGPGLAHFFLSCSRRGRTEYGEHRTFPSLLLLRTRS